jgi:hypothetical protein
MDVDRVMSRNAYPQNRLQLPHFALYIGDANDKKLMREPI